MGTQSDAAPRFGGWRVSAVLASLTVLLSLVSVPRPVEPEHLPMPIVGAAQLRQLLRATEAREHATPRLPYEVRAVGEAYRAVGRAHASGQGESHALEVLRSVTHAAARAHGGHPLMLLRDVQSQLFLAAALSEESEARRSELSELLGEPSPPSLADGRVLRDVQPELLALFRVRWAELTGLHTAVAFRPTAAEHLLAARLQLVSTTPFLAEELTRARLAAVATMTRFDDTYPSELARGIILQQAQRPGLALDAYRRFLIEHTGGPYALAARNYFASVVRQVVADSPQ